MKKGKISYRDINEFVDSFGVNRRTIRRIAERIKEV